MWALKKPMGKYISSDVQKIRKINDLDDATIAKLESFYTHYDSVLGDATKCATDTLGCNNDDIVNGYFQKTKGRGCLHKIRDELMEGVNICPYCGIEQVNTLDHFLPQKSYKVFSVLRYNLIPACSTCNASKGRDINFVHPYYLSNPNKVFLTARVEIQNGLPSFSFCIANNVLSKDTTEKCKHQWESLKLESRVENASIQYLGDCFAMLNDVNDIGKIIANQEMRYGANDWHTAILKALNGCPEFSQDVLKRIKEYPLNRGGI